jgi:hypothetical protein
LNTFSINLGASTYNNLQLGPRDNAMSAGDFVGSSSGAFPVLQFAAGMTGVVTFAVSLREYGRFAMVISADDGIGGHSMFEMDWVVIP